MSQNKNNQTKLIFRYLLWAYKTTKESLDWIDRKTTQLAVDRCILKDLLKNLKCSLAKTDAKAYTQKIEEFKDYIFNKEDKEKKEKYLDPAIQQLKPEYVYLQDRLTSIEKAIISFLGVKELSRIKSLYEQEMTRRILEARDHS